MAESIPHYFLVFCNRYCWQTLWLKKGFKHVVLGIYYSNQLFLLERKLSFYVIEAHNISEEEAIRRLFKIEGISRIEHVKSVNFPSFGKKIGIYLNIGSCLSIAKMFLNIPFFIRYFFL